MFAGGRRGGSVAARRLPPRGPGAPPRWGCLPWPAAPRPAVPPETNIL